MKQLLLLMLVVVGGRAVEQTNKTVLPEPFSSQPGNASDPLFIVPFEFQQVFRQSSAATAWETPVRITGVAFRLNETASSFDAVIPRVEIRFATTSKAPEEMLSLWSYNSDGSDSLVFLHDNVSLFAAAGQPLSEFDLRFHLDQPFDYDPSLGHLAMFVKTPGAAGARVIDANSYADRDSAPAGAITPNFVGPAAYGVVTEFTWVAIPEPSSSTLLAIALLFVTKCFGGK